MRKLVMMAAVLGLGAGMASAEPLLGTWQTAKDDNGHSGLIEVAPVAEVADRAGVEAASGELAAGGHFTDVTAHDALHDVAMTPERYLGLWRSHNRLATYAGPMELERIMHELAGLVDDRELRIPYRCCAWTARRR